MMSFSDLALVNPIAFLACMRLFDAAAEKHTGDQKKLTIVILGKWACLGEFNQSMTNEEVLKGTVAMMDIITRTTLVDKYGAEGPKRWIKEITPEAIRFDGEDLREHCDCPSCQALAKEDALAEAVEKVKANEGPREGERPITPNFKTRQQHEDEFDTDVVPKGTKLN